MGNVIVFGAPLALFGLLTLPLIFWLTRAIPSPPQPVTFPPTHLLAGLRNTAVTPQKSPLWLLVLRLLALALIVTALAQPTVRPPGSQIDTRPLSIVIDNGWALAPHWQSVKNEARQAIEDAAQANVSFRLLFTAPDVPSIGEGDALSAQAALARLDAALPMPWAPDPMAAKTALVKIPQGGRIMWFSDGLTHKDTDAFIKVLAAKGDVSLRTFPPAAFTILNASASEKGYFVQLRGSVGAASRLHVQIEDAAGRPLGAQFVSLPTDGRIVTVEVPLEAAISRRAAAARIVGITSAGAVRLIGSGDRRPQIGLFAPPTDTQPLVADAYFLQRALSPFSTVSRGDIAALARAGLDAIILPDTALTLADRDVLRPWVERGGMLIRFAGPRLADSTSEPNAQTQDDLLPAPLRGGARVLEGGVAFGGALGLAPFSSDSPFVGLKIPSDTKVRTLVLIDPAASPVPSIWASLSDGTPLVATRTIGAGRVVFFATTAGPMWGDLALSGLQPAMLETVLKGAGSLARRDGNLAQPLSAPLPPRLLVDGFGRIRTPLGSDKPLSPQFAQSGTSSQFGRPPGLYADTRTARHIGVIEADQALVPLTNVPTSITVLKAAPRALLRLGGVFMALGMGLLLIDGLLALVISGAVRWPRPRTAHPALVSFFALGLGLLLALHPVPTHAQAPDPLTLRLAYIETTDPITNSLALAGLRGLSRFVRDRTAAEPDAPISVDVESDDLGATPILFWIVPAGAAPPSPGAATKITRFLATGGMLFVDTRGNVAAGRRALQGIALPPIVSVAENHTLLRAFYLLRNTPGRRSNARLFVETDAAANDGTSDGASSVLIGDGDWASAWAADPEGKPLYAVEGGERGRELALRFGANVIIYALTGTYKSDQVHVPALLDRMRR